MIKLTLRSPGPIPLDVEGITPEVLNGLNDYEVAKLLILYGNRREPLGDHFDVGRGIMADIQFAGDTRNVHRIGAGMTGGSIYVENNAGMHAGAQMSGGSLIVDSGTGNWAGAEMRGGRIEIRHDAGHQLGGAYAGSRHGMRGGMIVVFGGAGDEAGALMRRGVIAVRGKVGAFAGAGMIAGTIAALGGVGPGCGAGMKRGTILVGGPSDPLPPGFRYSCEYEPAWLGLFAQAAAEWGFDLPRGPVRCHRGDILTGGRGEVLMLPGAA